MDPHESFTPHNGRSNEETPVAAPPVAEKEDPSFLMRTEVCQGSRPGDVRVRWVRPAHDAFRRLGSGVLEATTEAEAPRTNFERTFTTIKRFLIGAPLASAHAEHERLNKFQALAVLSSDAISSVAYATEAILITLVAAGSKNLWLTLFICIAIVALLTIVAISYRQTIPAYPNGGGSYIVAKDNLGTLPGLIAAASLMIDYVLTVSVSIAAGVQALATLFPVLAPDVVPIDVALVVIITIVNLRGVRESGTIFCVPTYMFIGSALFLILVGCIKVFLLGHQPLFGHFQYVAPVTGLSLFLLLRSFAAGCAAMTGTEAISNGIPAFRKPETKNAAITLMWMAIILGVLFIGITILALAYGVEANEAGNPTVIGQVAQQVFTGPLFFMYPFFQLSTLFILTLAANTSYSDFPRLSSLLARDHFLPHQFAFRGDRLAFSTGIISLAVLASLLLIIFKGDTTLLINLYAVGVFISFTLSQGGMVRHWWHLRHSQAKWLRSMIINGLGAAATFLVALIISTTKFADGAWMVVLLIPILILMFIGIHSHYTRVERERTTDIPLSPKDIHHHLIVPIARFNQTAQQCLAYARSIPKATITALCINLDPQKTEALQNDWAAWKAELTTDVQVQLEIVEPTSRSLVRSLLDSIQGMKQEYPDETLTIVLPDTAEPGLLNRLLTHPTSFRIKMALYLRPEIVVTNVPRYEGKDPTPVRPHDIGHRFIVPIAELDRVSMQSLAYARSISPHVTAVHVAINTENVEIIREKWDRLQKHMAKEEETQLVVIESPYRSLLRPLIAYIETVRELHPEETLTVILPEFVVKHWWEYPLHNQTAFQLKAAFLAQPSIVVTNISQHLQKKQMNNH